MCAPKLTTTSVLEDHAEDQVIESRCVEFSEFWVRVSGVTEGSLREIHALQDKTILLNLKSAIIRIPQNQQEFSNFQISSWIIKNPIGSVKIQIHSDAIHINSIILIRGVVIVT